MRTFVNNAIDQVPTGHLAAFAQPWEFPWMLHACLAVRQCISFTVWGLGDADSWIPVFFTGEGYATIYDVNLQPKPAYLSLQQDLELAAFGAPHRADRAADQTTSYEPAHDSGHDPLTGWVMATDPRP